MPVHFLTDLQVSLDGALTRCQEAFDAYRPLKVAYHAEKIKNICNCLKRRFYSNAHSCLYDVLHKLNQAFVAGRYEDVFCHAITIYSICDSIKSRLSRSSPIQQSIQPFYDETCFSRYSSYETNNYQTWSYSAPLPPFVTPHSYVYQEPPVNLDHHFGPLEDTPHYENAYIGAPYDVTYPQKIEPQDNYGVPHQESHFMHSQSHARDLDENLESLNVDDPASDDIVDPTCDPPSDETVDPTSDPTSDDAVDPTSDPTSADTVAPTFVSIPIVQHDVHFPIKSNVIIPEDKGIPVPEIIVLQDDIVGPTQIGEAKKPLCILHEMGSIVFKSHAKLDVNQVFNVEDLFPYLGAVEPPFMHAGFTESLPPLPSLFHDRVDRIMFNEIVLTFHGGRRGIVVRGDSDDRWITEAELWHLDCGLFEHFFHTYSSEKSSFQAGENDGNQGLIPQTIL